MAEIVRMPAVLAGAAEAAIQTWLVQPGTQVTVDQTLAEIETEKAIVEFQSEIGGVVGRLLASEGDNVAVGDPILVLVAPGEGDDAIDAALAASRAIPTPTATPATPAVPADAPGDHGARRMFASPLVRRLAAQNAVDLADIVGTGPHGRIVRRDLERHVASAAAVGVPVEAAQPAPPAARAEPLHATGYEDVPLDRMRAAIARRLTESKATVPHFYLVADCRVDALLALRAQVNEGAARRISVNDFVLKAVAGAMTDVPAANAIWNGDSIRRFASVDIGVAIATDAGLTTPVLRGVERLAVSEVSAAVADFAERARSGRLRQHELEGGSFSVSNLGMYGTERFTAILNPPQSGILAVGAARKSPVVGAAGELEVGTVMTVTLSADHRVIDGAVAAQWLAAFQRRIENPLTILI
jgi:pyruvate dehydrogenase E2 component (dihydrolipoamide acetyltransferase)